MFTTLGEGDAIKEVLDGLQKSSGFLRARLGQLLSIRIMPLLQFRYDDSVERGARLSRLIDDALGENKRPEAVNQGDKRR
jgi:ribosome-binding factor A